MTKLSHPELRLSAPRVAPLTPAEWSDSQARILKPVFEQGQVYSNVGTLARNAAAFDKILAWGAHVINGTTLCVRDRELAILRTGWLCRCHYVWRQHIVIAQREGLAQTDIDAMRTGDFADASAPVAVMTKAVDELVGDQFIADETWMALETTRSTEQIMDIIYTVGTYVMTSAMMNSLGVQLDEGFEATPERAKSGLKLDT